jgi:hypothetical protein
MCALLRVHTYSIVLLLLRGIAWVSNGIGIGMGREGSELELELHGLGDGDGEISDPTMV